MIPRLTAVAMSVALVAGCSADTAAPEPTTTSTTTTTVTTTTAATITTTTTEPAPPTPIAAPNGRVYPSVPDTAQAVADRLVEIETLLHTIASSDDRFADLAHEQQMLYRHIGRHPEWLITLWSTVPADLLPTVEAHVTARQAIAGIPHGDPPVNVPAWRIIEPLPADELRTLYEQAAADTGIDWTYLAAINLLETGFGRIDGLSTAGAQGPMQFLPSTWEEVSDGDIDDPYDAIPAAARYLVRRGGPGDMARALFGYNNSDSYVAAVSTYADLFRTDPAAFAAVHQWEIHYSAAAGDLWFPVGYEEPEVRPVTAYLADAPWSAPPPTP